MRKTPKLLLGPDGCVAHYLPTTHGPPNDTPWLVIVTGTDPRFSYLRRITDKAVDGWTLLVPLSRTEVVEP